ncbi:hypothetical protein HDU82_004496 [Entophlyctis luteolus]|nr:hypothetical protein HDU82_004496 [Entophlyctis luteolus]
MSSVQTFAPVGTAVMDASPGRRALVVAPALVGIAIAAHSVLVWDRAMLACVLSLAWLGTVVLGPRRSDLKWLYASLLDRWWAFSLAAVFFLSLFPQSHQPHLSSRVVVKSTVDNSLLVSVSGVSGLPMGCVHSTVQAFAVFRGAKAFASPGRSGEWAFMDVAEIPHERYFQIPAANASSSIRRTSKLSGRPYNLKVNVFELPRETASDSDIVVKIGVRCKDFPAGLIFGRELWLLDGDSKELHKFQSAKPLRPPKPPILPLIVLKVLNPLMWPYIAFQAVCTYTTLIELGFVWPILTQILKKILVNYREQRVLGGKHVVDLDIGTVKTFVVLAGVRETFAALGALIVGSVSFAPRRPRGTPTTVESAIATETAALATTVPTLNLPPASHILNGPKGAFSASPDRIRSSSSPVRQPDSRRLSESQQKSASTQSLWPSSQQSSSRSSRIVGSLISSINKAAGGGRRRRWEIPGYVFVVIKNYDPVFRDELPISIGNIIHIKKIFDDGWAVGVNQQTNVQGILPMAFLTCINPSSPSAPPIDPQQFIPRPGTGGTNSMYHSNSTTSVYEEVVMPSEFSDAPPAHLRKRGRSIPKTPPAQPQEFLEPQIQQSQPTFESPVVSQVGNPPTDPAKSLRGRSSSLHRLAARGRSASKKPVVSKGARSGSARSNQSAFGAAKSDTDKFEDARSAVAVGAADLDDVTVVPSNSGEGDIDVEEVVVFEDNGFSDEDRDAWPRRVVAGAVGSGRTGRLSKVSLGGYSRVD